MKFIKTMHSSTAEVLKNLGFQLVSDSNGVYVFLNSENLKFSKEVDMKTIQYSNMLCI